MMTFITVLLTTALILDCLLLGLLILVQLPKKDAGVGMAFGGGTADALFGAGSGNTLTKMTKYSAGIFFALVFILSSLNMRAHNAPGTNLRRGLEGPIAPTTQGAPAAQPAAQPVAVPAPTSNAVMDLKPTNAPATTNAPK